MAEKIEIEKILDDLFKKDNNLSKQFKPYLDVMKTFIATPGLSEIFETSMKEFAVNDGKLDLKKFYKRIKLLLIEMSEFYDWNKTDFCIPNDNIWNKNYPLRSLPGLISHSNCIGNCGEYNSVVGICNRVQTDLKKLTVEDFKFLNELHQKYKKGQ